MSVSIFNLCKNKTITITISVVLFFLFPVYCNSQNVLKGYVTSLNNLEPVKYCSILIKSTDNVILAYTTTNEEGFYNIELPKKEKVLLIETSIITYINALKEIALESSLKNRTYELNFKLKSRITALKEVYIETKKPPITVKKDTTIYNISQFTNGSERVVEDLLKKLPGITLSDNGLIKFKGKKVSRVLLDGDNIFDENYTIGTKNIDSEIVEGIQAIEDYHDNPLLKGVKNSNNVAVNLVLKKGMADVSGNADIGLGVKDKKALKINSIVISKKIKGFSTLSYNNVSENYSPYNFSSNIIDIAKANENSQRTTNLVTTPFSSNLPDNRTRINSNYFGSVNSLYKFNKKLSLRVNYGVFKDKLKRSESNNTNYSIEGDNFDVNTQENSVKKPLINTFEYELIKKGNKNTFLTSKGKLDYQNIENISNVFNNELQFSNVIKSKDLFFKNRLEYTYKPNRKKVFQLLADVSINNLPQSVSVVSDTENFNQHIEFKKNTVNIESKLLSKGKKAEYSLTLGYNYNENFIDSKLEGITLDNQFLSNNIYYRLSKFHFNLTHLYRYKKWQFSSSIKNELLNISLNDSNLENNYDKYDFLMNPAFNINYSLTRKSHFYTGYNFLYQPPNVSNIYSGLVFTNNRTLRNNNLNFKIAPYHSLNFGYRINNFYNLFQFNIYSRYNYNKYGYVSQLNVNEDRSFYTSILDVTNNKRISFCLDVEKYIDYLKSTFNIKSSYNISEYDNIINNSEIRNNKNKTFSSKLNIRTGFKGNINFTNKILFNVSKYEVSSNMSNSFVTFQNDFLVNYVKTNFQFNLVSQYFNPDLKSNISGDLFLDTSIIFKPKKSKIEYGLMVNNLLNKKVYRNINASDFSTSVFEHNLVERFLLLSANFKF